MSGDEEEGVSAGLSAMEAEFVEIDKNGRWSAVYQVGTSPRIKVKVAAKSWSQTQVD